MNEELQFKGVLAQRVMDRAKHVTYETQQREGRERLAKRALKDERVTTANLKRLRKAQKRLQVTV